MTNAETALQALDVGELFISLDATMPGVDVPDDYLDDENLVLKFSYRYGSSLSVNDWGIRQDLSFNGKWHHVRVPWNAVNSIQGKDR